ncbi:hypothetical protein QFZ71_003583 [Streptomyces sp. V2I9]|nr:hypothetical protein [Streptomyces sp. V2I9]
MPWRCQPYGLPWRHDFLHLPVRRATSATSSHESRRTAHLDLGRHGIGVPGAQAILTSPVKRETRVRIPSSPCGLVAQRARALGPDRQFDLGHPLAGPPLHVRGSPCPASTGAVRGLPPARPWPRPGSAPPPTRAAPATSATPGPSSSCSRSATSSAPTPSTSGASSATTATGIIAVLPRLRGRGSDRFGDVLNLVHPGPADDKPWQGDLFQHALDRRMKREGPIPDTLPLLRASRMLTSLPVQERRSSVRDPALVTSPGGLAGAGSRGSGWPAGSRGRWTRRHGRPSSPPWA